MKTTALFTIAIASSFVPNSAAVATLTLARSAAAAANCKVFMGPLIEFRLWLSGRPAHVGRKPFAACECRRQDRCTGGDRLLRRHDRAGWLIVGKFPIR